MCSKTYSHDENGQKKSLRVRILLKVALNIITLTLRVKGHIQYFAVWTKIFNFIRITVLRKITLSLYNELWACCQICATKLIPMIRMAMTSNYLKVIVEYKPYELQFYLINSSLSSTDFILLDST
jgi:hypothetical protein